MRLSVRLSLLMVLLTLLPALPAAWVTNQLIGQSLNQGLNPQVDGALEAGVRRARQHLMAQRTLLKQDLADWTEEMCAGIGDSEDALRDRLTASSSPPAAGDRITLFFADGTTLLLHAGAIPDEPEQSDSSAGAPPASIATECALPNGWRLTAQRSLPVSWREDATLLAATLQDIRGLLSVRPELESVFWLPFLTIYGFALLVGLVLATHLGQGITGPVKRLVSATESIATGNWDVEVPVTGRDEIGRLGEGFNKMVHTLEAQSRNLVEFEKMAGWREMARALAHEVKNPLTPIQLTVEEIRARYEGDDPEYTRLLDECTRIIVEEVKSLRNIVTRFREFSRPVDPTIGPVDINDLLTDLAALQKDLAVELDLDGEIGIIEADADRLRQVLMNLAQNARAATAACATPSLRLVSRRAAERVTLLIEDNGPGIPLAERDHVFEPYRSGTAGGLGLGLALVKGIILAHQGVITVEEGSLGGARIRLDLPRKAHRSASASELQDVNERPEAIHE
ncbi:MAG: HAMP domain-containing protein [bacterium]|nr:HAMP domain-containing protein [bacterium]